MLGNELGLNFKEGKRTREELYLERIYYIAVDPLNKNSWINAIGEKAFVAWLKMQTLVDRSAAAESKYGNLETVPRSIEDLAKTLGMSRSTLYYKVLTVLWDYGFIDFEEWTEQKKIGQKAINVIVYPYPQNNIELQYKPLTKVRNYATDYSSNAKTYNNVEIKRKRAEQKEELYSSNYEAKFAHNLLIERLKEYKIKDSVLREIKYELAEHPTTVIPFNIAEDQLIHMHGKLTNGEPIYNFAKYFVGGVATRTEILESMTGVKVRVEEIEKQKALTTKNGITFYNWLEEN